MTTPTRRRSAIPRQDPVAKERLRFLSAELPEPTHVRQPIFTSWVRSRDLHVAADRVQPDYSDDMDSDTPLVRSAQPVLRNLRAQLDDQPMSIILTDATGLVLSRQSGDADLERHLDSRKLAPGFSYSEGNVGTNGIGTALEIGGPAWVFGHEHYAEKLEGLSCAGVPIRHPVSGRTVGVIDLTCWAKDAGPLLLTLAKNTAEQIRQSLLADAGAQQLELLQAYMRTCHRLPGIVFAIAGETVILNDQARRMLDPVDQAALLAHAGESLLGRRPRSVHVELPSGAHATMYGNPVGQGPAGTGAVVHVKLGVPSAAGAGGRVQWMPLPGLVGTDPSWLRACRDVETASSAEEWLVVSGEPGVGKLAILQAVQLRHQPIRRIEVLDAADATTDPGWAMSLNDALTSSDGLIVQHVDQLDGPRLRGLSSALDQAKRMRGDRPQWVAVTVNQVGARSEMTVLTSLFPKTVDVPPLRLHPGDMPALVAFFLARLGPSEHLTCSPEALATLCRCAWPGNAQQLVDSLRTVLRHRRTGMIQLEDLPPSVRTGYRRLLSQLEAMERDAVVQALVDTRGDKTRAARTLGLSRATIYRKIHEYGIVVGSS